MNAISTQQSEISNVPAPPSTCARGRPLTLTTGQIVHWPAAPLGWAQVIDLRRTTVRLLYRCKSGRRRFPIVAVAELHRLQHRGEPLLPLFNPFGRGGMGRAKTFETG